MKYIYIGTLERFGYELTVASKSYKAAEEALIEKYIEAYMNTNNGEHPDDDTNGWGQTYLESAKEDIVVIRYEIGKVEWR